MDVAVKDEIYAMIGAMADAGCAVVIVSSDMLEVLGLATASWCSPPEDHRLASGGRSVPERILRLAMPPSGDAPVASADSAGSNLSIPDPGDRSAAALIQTQGND